MVRVFCVLFLLGILCSCADDPQPQTFKDKYNVYDGPEIAPGAPRLPLPNAEHFPGTSIYGSANLMWCDVPINELEDFADALIRRMGARTIAEHRVVQEEIDTLYQNLLNSVNADRGVAKYGYERHLEVMETDVSHNVLPSFYNTCREADIKKMVATVQYTRYLISVFSAEEQ